MTSKPDLQQLARQWGANAVPFSAGNSQDWLDTPQAQDVVVRLHQTATLRAALLLSGVNGVGKSALAGRWLRSLDSRLFVPLILTQATLSGSSILGALTTKLGQPASFRRERNLQFIEQALAQLDRRIPVLLLDEAQNYSHSSLEEVRLLLGLNLLEHPAFALILIGDEYLLSTLKLRNHRALYSRLSCHITLQPWSVSQSVQYLERALVAVGLSSSRIEPPAMELLVNAAGGIPRSLALLARAAWIAAATQAVQTIGTPHAQSALDTVPFAPGLHQPAQPLDPAP